MIEEAAPRQTRAIPWGFVLAVASIVSLSALTYYYVQGREMGGERQKLVKERSSLAASIAEDLGTMRGRVEPWTVALATQPWPGDLVDPDARSLTWRERPIVYARVRAADATSNESVHTFVKASPLDGLSACLLRSKGPGPWSYGEVIARSEFLGADWVRDVKETKNDLRLRNLTYAFDQYKQKDFPEARDAVKLAEYSVIVVDEDPPQVPATSPAFGESATMHQKILGTLHPIRFSLRRLADGRELIRLRRTPEATVVQVAGDPTANAAAIEVRRIQTNGCAMANEALELAGSKPGPGLESAPLPAIAAAAPSASAALAGSASAAPSGSGSAAPGSAASAAPSASAAKK